jgi:Tol biopolymer transport system component
VSRHAHRGLVAISLAALAVSAIVAPVSANFPGVNGQILYQTFDDNGNWQIWVANPDLSHQRQITDGDSWSGWATWSPDGSRIAFTTNRADPDPTDGTEIVDVFTMRPDGSDVRKVTDSVGWSGHPAYSPDGRWIVYAADRGDYPASMGLYVISSDGSGLPRRVTHLINPTYWQELPRFSPDGTHIAFSEGGGGNVLNNRNEGRIVAEQEAIYTVKADGTDLRQITPWGVHASDADWSPDGKQIVFANQPTHIGDIGDVMVVDADGRHPRNLTNDGSLIGIGNNNAFVFSQSFNPVWSPDGRTILFVHVSYSNAAGYEVGLQTVNPDGTGRGWLSTIRGEDHQPEWGTLPPIP